MDNITINTGGLKKLGYAEPSPDYEFDEGIDRAYEKARVRKKKEKFIKILIVVVIILVLGVWFFVK